MSSIHVFVGIAEPAFNGVSFGEAVGYAGFAAGPEKFIIDVVGLSDPLLARLPADRPISYEGWKSGHFRRTVPKGYVDSVAFNGNMIEDPELRRLYGSIRTITRGRIWSIERFIEIARINLGMYEVHSGGERAQDTLSRRVGVAAGRHGPVSRHIAARAAA